MKQKSTTCDILSFVKEFMLTMFFSNCRWVEVQHQITRNPMMKAPHCLSLTKVIIHVYFHYFLISHQANDFFTLNPEILLNCYKTILHQMDHSLTGYNLTFKFFHSLQSFIVFIITRTIAFTSYIQRQFRTCIVIST